MPRLRAEWGTRLFRCLAEPSRPQTKHAVDANGPKPAVAASGWRAEPPPSAPGNHGEAAGERRDGSRGVVAGRVSWTLGQPSAMKMKTPRPAVRKPLFLSTKQQGAPAPGLARHRRKISWQEHGGHIIAKSGNLGPRVKPSSQSCSRALV